MENPEKGYCTIDPTTMYKYDNHSNIPWNIHEYHTPRLEFDADLEVKKRKWQSQKKGVKNSSYVTKRGFYMDYDLKVAKGIPSPHAHGAQKEWSFEKIKKSGDRNKVDSKLIKYTFLDRIEMEQQKRKSPGISTYSIEKSLKEKDDEVAKLKKKKVSEGLRLFFYMNTEKLSDTTPGPGSDSPHQISPRLHLDKTDYKFWVDKHNKERSNISQRDAIKPAPGTHSPMNTTLNTFEQLSIEKEKPSKKNHFGLDSRFEYTREIKKKIIEKRPDPSSYQTAIEWKGKDVSPKKTTWTDLVWKGHSSSIYH